MKAPDPTLIFHFTAIGNLDNIFKSGYLKSNNLLKKENIVTTNISYSHIQERRDKKIIKDNLTLHDYVPFMFAPRSPMMYTLSRGNVPEAQEKNIENYIYFVSSVQHIHNLGIEYAFTDMHSTMAFTKTYHEIDSLEKIDWEMFFNEPLIGGYSKYFLNNNKYPKRCETREAEFLIKDKISINDNFSLVTKNDIIKEKVIELIKKYSININVEVESDWYY